MEMLRSPLMQRVLENKEQLRKLEDPTTEKAEIAKIEERAMSEFEGNRHLRRKSEVIERAKAKLINAT